jgi:hypothetical protein
VHLVLVRVGSHLVVVCRPVGVGEQLLEAPVDNELDGIQAPHAGAGRRATDRTRHEDALHDGLEPHLDLDRGPGRDRDDVGAEVVGQRHRALELLHRARSPVELPGVEHQWRAGIGTVHDSCAQ